MLMVPLASRRRAREADRNLLQSRPEALRAHLREKHVRFHGHLEQFGAAGAAALELLLASQEGMSDLERDAFATLVRQLDDDLLDPRATSEPVPPTVRDLDTAELLADAAELLADTYLGGQRSRVVKARAGLLAPFAGYRHRALPL